MFRLPLVIVCAVLASSGAWAQAQRRPVPEATACNNDDDTCRENCTIEFGSSIRTRQRLGLCLEKCRSRHARCVEQWREIHTNDLDPTNFGVPAAEAQPAPAPLTDEAPADDPAAFEPADDAAPYEQKDTSASGRTRYHSNDDASKPEETDSSVESPPSRADAAERKDTAGAKPPAPRTQSDEGRATARRDEQQKDERPAANAKQNAEVKPPAKTLKSSDLPPEPRYDISDWDPDAEE